MNEFIIEGKAVPKQRPRKGKYGKFYTPQKTKDFEKKVQWSYLSCRHRTFFAYEPLKVNIEINLKKPKYSKKDYPTTRSDLDNQMKSIFDALNGLAYTDDKQIIEISALRKFADRDFIKVKLEKIETEEVA